jgi:hypothetical protein
MSIKVMMISGQMNEQGKTPLLKTPENYRYSQPGAKNINNLLGTYLE